ncbi:MAG TPA: FHA domain-containing protein [Candidatus Binataceae bacterium]|nr:FHA domain-containing protein [Candidatus Binataceae bacterium]
MIKCSECGYENIDGLDYCDGCGAKLTAAPASAGESGAVAAPEPAAQPEPAAEPAPVAAAEEPPAAPPPSEAPTGEIKPPPEPEAHAVAAAAAPAAEAPAAPAPAAAAGSSARAKLQVVRGGRKGQEFPLEDGNNLVGRWDPETGAFPEVDLDQDDPEAKISRKHALIRFEAGKITVEDIGSLNGTYVNRQPRLMPGNPVELKPGDEIIIGKTFLKLVVDPVS